jgi:hypothetical protein
MSRFLIKNGAGVSKDKRLLISDDEDEDAENGPKASWRATPDTKKTPREQQQRSSPFPPSSPDDRGAPQQRPAGLAGLVAPSKTTTPTKSAKTATTPPPMSFTEVINKASASTTEKSRNSRASPSPPKTQSPVPVASQRANNMTSAADEDEDEDEYMTLRIPGSFGLANYEDADAAVEPFDGVGVLGDLWRRMQMER